MSESTEMIEGPNGMGGIETVTVSVNGVMSTREGEGKIEESLRAEGGVTQGELLRQEQRAGVVPVSQQTGSLDGMGEEEEVPHARGPDEIGEFFSLFCPILNVIRAYGATHVFFDSCGT